VSQTIGQAYIQIMPTTKGIAGNLSKEFDGVGGASGDAMGKGIMANLKKFAGPIAAIVSVGALVKLGKDLTLAGEVAKTSNDRIRQISTSMDLFGDDVGKVTDRLIANAEATALQTGMDQNSIKQTQAKLLTFGALAESAGEVGGAFDRAMMAAIDLEAAGFGPAEGQAVALGKALNNPIKGMAALGKSGITFTEIEKEKIQALQESGDLLGAQEILLEAIEGQVQGTAAATADMSAQFGVAASQVKERFGTALSDAFDRIGTPLLEKFFPLAMKAADAFGPLVENAVDFFLSMLEGEGSMSPIIALFKEIIANLPELLPMLSDIGLLVREVVAVGFAIFMDILKILVETILPILMDVFQSLVPVIMELVSAVLELAGPLIDALAPVLPVIATLVASLIQAFAPLIAAVLPILIKLIEFLTPILIKAGEIIGKILVGAINIFTGVMSKFSGFISGFSATFQKIWGGIRTFFQAVFTGFGIAVEVFQKIFTTIWDAISGTFSKVINGIKNTFTSVWNGIKAVFTKVIDAIGKGIDKFKTTFESVFNGVSNFFKGIINGIIGGFEKMVNGVIGGINKMTGALNKLSFDVPDWVPLIGGKSFSLSIPSIPTVSLPRLARGGTLLNDGSVMVGEKGPEILTLPGGATVTPLDHGGPTIVYNAAQNESLDSEKALMTAVRRARVLASW
jgi:phage-related protein